MIGIPCCRDLARLVATDEMGTSPWYKRTCARFHLWMCRDCRAYVEQIRAIGQSVRDLHSTPDAKAHADELIELLKRK